MILTVITGFESVIERRTKKLVRGGLTISVPAIMSLVLLKRLEILGEILQGGEVPVSVALVTPFGIF